MAYRFSDTAPYVYREGDILLGLDDDNRKIGIDPETHLVTTASSGSGKGVGLIINNCRLWSRNLLVIDPKGENAALSWEAREAMGQTVHVVDPFGKANVPERLRATFNPLDHIEVASLTAREDIEVIADGIVVRSDEKHAQWDNGAADLIAGAIAYTLHTMEPETRTLGTVRNFLMLDDDTLKAEAEKMAEIDAFGGLIRAVGVTILAGFKKSDTMEADFLEGARRHTKWIDSDPIKAALSRSTFHLSKLKTGNASVFLVLPPRYISTRAAFLRLFVRSAIDAMMAQEQGKRCLFILDEFAQLGKIEEITKVPALMRSYGLHLWPFLQDFGQMPALYGEKVAGTFFANADAHVFFGIDQDAAGLNFVSRRLGSLTETELVDGPPPQQAFQDVRHNPKYVTASVEEAKARHQADQQNAQNDYRHALGQAGKPRLTPDQIAKLTGKEYGAKLARSMIVFLKGGDVLNLRLSPFDDKIPVVADPLPFRSEAPKSYAPIPLPQSSVLGRISAALLLLALQIGWWWFCSLLAVHPRQGYMLSSFLIFWVPIAGILAVLQWKVRDGYGLMLGIRPDERS